MKNWLRKIFRRKEMAKAEAIPLKIDGVAPAPITAEPDDAELAAHALLDSFSHESSPKGRGEKKLAEPQLAEKGTAEYYRQLAERIEKAYMDAVQRTTRFVAFCEQELKNPNLPMEGPGSLSLLETELYKRIDTVDREGGELKLRWQHCLAEVTVRLMEMKDEE